MFISSDTNIWVDFLLTNAIKLPFRLPHTFCMSSDAIDEELVQPRGIAQTLLKYGLQRVEITQEEFDYVLLVRENAPKLSVYDCFALAIAKMRGYILLTGDARLRKKAVEEGVEVHGTLWLFDQLKQDGIVTAEEYRGYMKELLRRTKEKDGVRLPISELNERISKPID